MSSITSPRETKWAHTSGANVQISYPAPSSPIPREPWKPWVYRLFPYLSQNQKSHQFQCICSQLLMSVRTDFFSLPWRPNFLGCISHLLMRCLYSTVLWLGGAIKRKSYYIGHRFTNLPLRQNILIKCITIHTLRRKNETHCVGTHSFKAWHLNVVAVSSAAFTGVCMSTGFSCY